MTSNRLKYYRPEEYYKTTSETSKDVEAQLYEKNWDCGEGDDSKYSYKQNMYGVCVSSSKRMRRYSLWLGGRKYKVYEKKITLPL